MPSEAKRTTTRPPGSVPVTTPSPNFTWVTSSPSAKVAPGPGSTRTAGAPAPPEPPQLVDPPLQLPAAARADGCSSASVSAGGISPRKRLGTFHSRPPYIARVRAWVR